MRCLGETTVWLAMWAAFFLFGVALQECLSSWGAAEVLGYDYATFIRQLGDVGWITYTGVRHPGLGMVMSPVVLLGQFFQSTPVLFKGFLIAVYAAIGTMNVWLVWRLGGWLAAGLFLCFGFTWVLATVPESFPLAMLTLLSTVAWAAKAADQRRRMDGVWVFLFVLTTAITVTNGLKVLVAYLVVNRLGKRQKLMLFAAMVCVAAVGCGYFALRMMRWNALHPEAPKTIMGALAQTANWIPEGVGFWGRVRMGAVNFLAVPVLPWIGGALGKLAWQGRLEIGWLGYSWVVIVYAAAVAGAWVNRRLTIVRVMGGMLVVDVLIHVIFAWGLDEGWIFCAHWFYMLPICIGIGARSLRRYLDDGASMAEAEGCR